MNIDLQAQAQTMLSTKTGQDTGLPANSNTANTANAALPVFSQLLSSQVKVFQDQGTKNTVTTTQLLSPHVEHATKIEARAREFRAASAGDSANNGQWANQNKMNTTGTAANVLGLRNAQNMQANVGPEFAYAKFAEMQAQAKNMRLLAKGTGVENATLMNEGEPAQVSSHPASPFSMLSKATLSGTDQKEQTTSKKLANTDTEAVTALGITNTENPGQSHEQSSGNDPSADPEFTPIATNTLQGQIHTSFGSLQWCEEISKQMIYMSAANICTAVLNLNPHDLGPLKIVITVKGRVVDSTFISNNSEVRQSLQDNLEQLRSSMGQAGLMLGQADIRPGMDFQETQAQIAATLMPAQHLELAELVRDHQIQAAIIHYDGMVNVFV